MPGLPGNIARGYEEGGKTISTLSIGIPADRLPPHSSCGVRLEFLFVLGRGEVVVRLLLHRARILEEDGGEVHHARVQVAADADWLVTLRGGGAEFFLVSLRGQPVPALPGRSVGVLFRHARKGGAAAASVMAESR